MSRHRAAPPGPGPAPPANRHRANPVHPRYGRIAVLGSSVAVTAVALLGGIGVLPSVAHDTPSQVAEDKTPVARLASDNEPKAVTDEAAEDPRPDVPAQEAPSSTPADEPGSADEDADNASPEVSVPVDSGDGRRVVFSQADQRVWLVDEEGSVERTYLVSGSVYDNLDPGTYAVFSRSEQAYGIEDSGSMRWFVRFTQGETAAIGFHDIPIDDGVPVQTQTQLGTPLSHGCIRQKTKDALALWDFAPLGTEVVVV